MTRKPSAAGRKVRLCAFCGFPLVETRPVFLTLQPDQRITGPLHAGCAERLVLAHRKHKLPVASLYETFGHVVPSDPGLKEAE